MQNNKNMDWRNIENGNELPKEGYCDQPYVIITDNGNWLCVMTTGKGEEGGEDQHIISFISSDKGKTWSDPVDIEPSGPPEASWVIPLKISGGRIYVFYTYNGDNLREVKAGVEKFKKRLDTLGYMAFKYSDDHGRSWSEKRYYVPMRLMEIDRENPYGGKVMFFWSICKPLILNNCVYISGSKVGNFGEKLGEGFITKSVGFVLKSDNIVNENDPEKINWETLPDGDDGIKGVLGNIAEEHYLTFLSDGSLYCTYRTTDGYNCHAYSRDEGHTWTPPEYMVYSPGGKKLKNPRAASIVRKFSKGKYLLWFHNHGSNCNKFYEQSYLQGYQDRNPAWLCGGIEKDGYIYWSQPEIVLYDENPRIRISYPDFIEDCGRFFITETQKSIARIHPIDKTLLEGMWNQWDNQCTASEGLVLEVQGDRTGQGMMVDLPKLPDLTTGKGFTIDFWICFSSLLEGQMIMDSRDEEGKGITLTTTDKDTVKIVFNDGRTESSWDCDKGILKTDIWHHIAVIVDGGPKIIIFIVDGVLCDGGEYRHYGWGRFSADLRDVTGCSKLKLGMKLNGKLGLFRLYSRYLRTSEIVGNFRAGRI